MSPLDLPSGPKTFVASLALVAALAAVVPAGLLAGEFNPVLSIGDAAPPWGPLPAVDGKEYKLSDFADSKVLVLAFTCNTCPYAVDHEKRLNELADKYSSQGVAIVAINPNTIEADQLPAMKQRAKDAGLDFVYLSDPSQQSARDYGATYTPEFFVIDQDRKVVYMGSMDDSPNGSKVTKKYLEDAVQATLDAKQPETTETVAVGCRIRMDRKARQKTAK
jgi:peroxiredoxin